MNVAKRKNWWARFFAWLGQIPHLFAKLVVLYCIAFVSAASFWALRIASRTGLVIHELLLVITGFFGGELLLLCLKTVLARREKRE